MTDGKRQVHDGRKSTKQEERYSQKFRIVVSSNRDLIDVLEQSIDRVDICHSSWCEKQELLSKQTNCTEEQLTASRPGDCDFPSLYIYTKIHGRVHLPAI